MALEDAPPEAIQGRMSGDAKSVRFADDVLYGLLSDRAERVAVGVLALDIDQAAYALRGDARL